MWRTALKAALGFLIGLALWWGASEPYGRVVARAAQPVLRALEDPTVTRLRPEGKRVIVERADFPSRSARPSLPLDDLTFNVILLCALFASNTPLFSNRNVAAFLGALPILFVTHVLALVVEVKSVYALQLGEWSRVHYGPVARNLWGGGAHFYRLVGVYGIAFALWWLLRPSGTATRASSAPPRKRRRRK